MTAAERKVRGRFPEGRAQCGRTVVEAAHLEGFRVRVWIDGERIVIGYGSTRARAWNDAARSLPAPLATAKKP